MSIQYDEQLVRTIQEKQYPDVVQEVNVIVKPIPDCDIPGAMDPRLYKKNRKIAWLSKLIPKKMMKMDLGSSNLNKLRIPFNTIDSSSFVEGVNSESFEITTRDGYSMEMVKFTSEITLDNASILYFIHGGGFFAGSSDVVAESLRYLVAHSGIIAIACNYRLAPDNPYPLGHQDVYDGLEWIYNHADSIHGNKDNIFVGGDSAGGNLTLYCTNQLIAQNKSWIKGQILLYPTVNMGGIEDEYTTFSLDKYEIYEKHRSVIQPMLEIFSTSLNSLDTVLKVDDSLCLELTPYLEVSLKMPPTFISCGEHDALLIESLAYAKKVQDLQIPLTFTLYKGMNHAYIDHMGNFPQAQECMDDIIQFIQNYS